MERKKNLIRVTAFCIALFLTTTITGQNRDSIFYKCYVTSDMKTWKQTMEQMEREYRGNSNYNKLFDVTLAWYGYIGYCIGNDRKDEAKIYLKSGWDHLEQLLDMPQAGAAVYAMKSGFYGFEMGMAKSKAMILGPKSVSALKEASAIDSSNVHFRVEKGNQMYYMPSIMGGDKDEALYHYKLAVESMKNGETYHRKHWFYLNTITVLAHTYERTQHIDEARNTYQKIMKQAPQFEWVKDELWPKFVEKHGK
jgi:tetratricopeptide (TPR) repeat protein